MDYNQIILFLLGLAAGSFLSVISFRYAPDRRIFTRDVSVGRSRCLACHTTLRFWNLIPLVSFLLQRGKCSSCGVRISAVYPVLELISGFMFVMIPLVLARIYNVTLLQAQGMPITWYYIISGFFILTFVALMFIAIVDIRFKIIPDQTNIFIAITGIAVLLIKQFTSIAEVLSTSFIGSYALLFGLESPVWLNHLAGALFGLLFLGAIFLMSKGRGMGMGDIKLAGALGLLIGWPDIVLALFLAFITGSLWSILLMIRGKKGLKSYVPFGPFIVLGVFLTWLCGSAILEFYFRLFP